MRSKVKLATTFAGIVLAMAMPAAQAQHSLSGQFEKTLSDFEVAVKRCPNILSCHLMSGEYDYILRIAAKDLADYERIHKQWLSAMPHVTKINSSFALREVIDRTALGLKPEMM